jgi:uncharacterized protein
MILTRAMFPVLAMLLLLVPATPSRAALELPPIPADQHFVQDYAGLLPSADERRIGDLQEVAFKEHETPIIVVTVESMADYGGRGYSIERFASEWFNHWQIGTRGDSGELVNQGILLLVSRDDRKARIELGADWGRRWDAYAARVMDQRIIPWFKEGDFASGITEGVGSLAEMARLGPDAKPPGSLGASIRERLERKPVSTSPLPAWGIGAMVLGGVAMIVASFFYPRHRKWLLIGGIGLIVAAVVFWIVVAVLAIVARSKSGASGDGGGFSGGGFGSGGFSGGGGASGSW